MSPANHVTPASPWSSGDGYPNTQVYVSRRYLQCVIGLRIAHSLIMPNVLSMLLGAALVAIGVLAAALADRIRGLRVSRDAVAPRDRPSRVQSVHAAIPVVDSVELLRVTPAAPAKPPRAPRAEAKVQSADGAEDVIAALIGAGYKKPTATEATWACSPAERATVESWVASALRRCVRGGMS